nr:hypothetical protein [Salmonid herpesvirus 1]
MASKWHPKWSFWRNFERGFEKKFLGKRNEKLKDFIFRKNPSGRFGDRRGGKGCVCGKVLLVSGTEKLAADGWGGGGWVDRGWKVGN